MIKIWILKILLPVQFIWFYNSWNVNQDLMLNDRVFTSDIILVYTTFSQMASMKLVNWERRYGKIVPVQCIGFVAD